MSKKPDYSSENLPKLKKYCKAHGLKFEWKNRSQGHVVISSESVEAFIYVQRMVTGVRKRAGRWLGKPIWDQPSNFRFDEKYLDRVLLINIKVDNAHRTKEGIVVTRHKMSPNPLSDNASTGGVV